jgi:hypothetical protein
MNNIYEADRCIQNIEVKNVSKVIIHQKANTKSSVRQHRTPNNVKVNVGSVAMEK